MQESVLLVSLLTPVKIPQKKKEMPFWTTSLSNFSGHFDWWPIHSYISISGITLYPRLPSGLIQKCFVVFFSGWGYFLYPSALFWKLPLSKQAPSLPCHELWSWGCFLLDMCFWPPSAVSRGGVSGSGAASSCWCATAKSRNILN